MPIIRVLYVYNVKIQYITVLARVSRPGGLAGKCAKVVEGGLHEGGGFTTYFERGVA